MQEREGSHGISGSRYDKKKCQKVHGQRDCGRGFKGDCEARLLCASWKNTQCVSYVFVRDEEKKARLSECVCGFAYNTKTIGRCKVLCAVVTEQGKSGCEEDGSFGTPRKDEWEMFDAGIAAQTFCLAARERGIGTVIMGYVDDGEAGEVLHLPEKKRVTAFIAMGYPEAEGKMPPRKSVDELMTTV